MYIPGYQIEHELGQGGMAVVYLALQESLGRHVALKVIKPNLTNDPEFAHRFLREGRIIAQLNHTHIVTVYDIGSHENTYYLSMEYLPGGTLQQRIHASFSLPEALITIRAIASALHYAHHRNIIHRDIKPQNILFRENGGPVLTDFGIAKTLGSSTLVTHTGLSIGTPRYMSPEQIRGQAVDARSDLYSLGVLFYEMLTHQVPYNAEDSFALAMMHVTSPIPELPSHLAHFQPLLSKLMNKEPAQRFQSGQEVIAALNVLENSMLSGLQETVILENTQITPPPRHGWKVGVPLAIALTGAAIGGGYLFLNRTEPPTTTPATPATTSPSVPTPQPPLVDPTVQKRTEMDRLLAQAIQQQQSGDLIASRDAITQGLRLDPNYPPLLVLREQVDQQLVAQDRAQREHEQQQQQQLQNQQQVDRLLQQAQRRRQEGALEASLAQIEQGLQLMPRHAVLLDLKRDVLEQRAKRQRDLENAARQAEAAEQQRIEAEQRQRAIAEQQKLDAERRKAAAEQRKMDAERQKAATELQRLKAEEFLERALDYQRDRAYEVSLLQIEQGLQQVPNHPQLLALRDEVRRQFRAAKTEAVPAPAPPATPLEDDEDKLAALLHKCDAHFKARRLASGKSGNATDCYRAALKIDSKNADALAGLERIADYYADQATAMLAQDNFKATRGALDKLNQINAAHPRLSDIHKRLETAEAAAKAAEIAAKTAEASAKAAQKTSPITSTATAPVDASTTVLERQPIHTNPAKTAEPTPASETQTPTAISSIDLISLPKATKKKPPAANSSTDEKPLAAVSNPASPKPITATPDRQSRTITIETDQYQAPDVPEPAPANTVPTQSTAARDWAAIKNSTDPEDIKQFIATYPQSRQAVLARNQLKQLQKQPVLLPARLSIDADVEDAQVTVNGRRLGTTPLEVELKPGSYKVRVSQEGYPDWSEQIQLDANANRLLTAVLSKSSVSAGEPISHVTERQPPKAAPEPKPVNTKPTKPTAAEPELAAGNTTVTQTAKVSASLNCVQGNCRNGEGIYRHADGSEYSGGFRNAKMHGQGTYIYAKRGEKYVGEWQNGVVDGQGVYYYNSGNRYEGEWRNGHKHGQGAYFYASGEKYVGDFQDDQPHGQGTYYYKNGDRYEGEWRDGHKHGQGIMYENGKKIIGEWENDRKVRVSVEK